MTVWVVKVTNTNDWWTSVDSVWLSELAARQRADYIHDNSDKHGDWWSADVVAMQADQCGAWPREARDA